MTKLTNVQFRTPVRLGMHTKETLLPTDGHAVMLDFPWVRLVPIKGDPVRTTIFNIARCDDWPDEVEPPKGKAGK